MAIIKFLRKIQNSKTLERRPFIRRFVSLIIDYDTETYETFSFFLLLLWGLWVLNPSARLISPVIVILEKVFPTYMFGYIAFMIGILGFIGLSKQDNIESVIFRKKALFSSTMFFTFLFFMNVIYVPTNTGTPIYFCLSIFSFWECLRLKSLEWDLKNGTGN